MLAKTLIALLAAIPAAEPVLTLRLIGNAGVEITDGRHVVLLDFPYQSGAYGYAEFTNDELRPRDESLCAFTHAHADHFDAAGVTSVGCKVVGPKAVVEQVNASFQGGAAATHGDAEIRCVPTEHGGGGVDHCSLALSWLGVDLIVAGDIEDLDELDEMARPDILLIPEWLAGAVAQDPRYEGVDIVLTHQARYSAAEGCSSCRTLRQGESMLLEERRERQN